LEQPGALVVVNSLDLIVVAHAELAVDFRLQGTAGIEKLRVLEGSARGARDEIQKILEIAIVAERHIFHQDGFQFAAGVGAFRLKNRGFRFDGDGFRYVARLKIQVDARSCIYDHVDAGAGGALEASEFGRDAIGTGRQIRENVIAAFVALGRAADICVGFRDGDFSVRDGSSGRVRDRAQESRVHGLRSDWSRSCGKGKRNKEHRAQDAESELAHARGKRETWRSEI